MTGFTGSANIIKYGCTDGMDARCHETLAKPLKEKRGRRGGFTIIEMLCAIVVLLLVSALMVVGIRLAVKAYHREVTHSEAQVLCSTIRTVVNDELRYSGTTSTSTSGVISFFSDNYGKNVSFSTSEDGQVYLGEKKILSEKAYANGIMAYVTITAYDSSTHIFSATVLVTDTDGTTELASESFQVKQLNKPASAG